MLERQARWLRYGAASRFHRYAGVSPASVDAAPIFKAGNKTETRDLAAKSAPIRLCKPNVSSIQHPDQLFTSLGRCLLEKPETQACAPDLVLYVGVDYPQWQPAEPRRIDLTQSRVPDLVGEISNTTLANDLDEQKHLYASIGISEYWVVDVRGQRVFAFQLQENGEYQICDESRILTGLPIALLEQALQRLSQGTNTSAAAWFAQRIAE